MRHHALAAIRDADAILHLIDATDPSADSLTQAAGLPGLPPAPVVTVLNKVDRLGPEQRAGLARRFPGAHLVSAITGEGVDRLLDAVVPLLPPGPWLYDADDVSDQHLRFFAAELVRETALEQLDEEVPYSVACAIEEFREDRNPVYIRAVVYVERESQKRIVIGHGGARIRAIGRAARLKIEELVGAPVYLDLWVKVLPDWRKDPAALRRLGYGMSEDKTI